MFFSTKHHKRIHPMRHLALVSLLFLTVTFPAGCAMSRSGSQTAATLRRDAATSLNQMTGRSEGADTQKVTSSELVQASFTKEADGDSAAFPIDSAYESEQPQWWNAAETENQSSTETTLSANSTTSVTTSHQTESWKPKRGWTATKPR